MFCCLVKDPAGRHIAPVDQHQVNTVKDDDKSESLQRNKPSNNKALAIAGQGVNAKTHTQMFCDQHKKKRKSTRTRPAPCLLCTFAAEEKGKLEDRKRRLEK